MAAEHRALSSPGARALLLALESSPGSCSAALLRGEALLAECESEGRRHNAERLLPAVDEVLAKAAVSLPDVDALAVAVGPGAFTSLRIAVATAKGLAFGSETPIAPVGSLAAIAWAETEAIDPDDRPVVALLDARREEAYAAAFRVESTGVRAWDEVLPESVYGLEALAERLPRDCILVGEGAGLFDDALRERLGPGVETVSGQRSGSLARAVAWLGAGLLAEGRGVAAAALTPRYLRRAEAEALRTAQPLE